MPLSALGRLSEAAAEWVIAWRAIRKLDAMPQLELVCPVCSNRDFREEDGRVPAGIGHHRLTMMICTQCNYVMQFYKKRTTL